MEFYWFLIFAFLAEIVGTFTGFGTTTILVPLASFFMSLPEAIVLAGGGSLVGFLAGLIGTAGALRGAFLTSWNLQRDVYLGTGAAMGLGADASRVLSYYQSGLVKSDFNLLIMLAVVALVGTFLGYKAVKFTKQKLFQKIILIALILAGIKFLI